MKLINVFGKWLDPSYIAFIEPVERAVIPVEYDKDGQMKFTIVGTNVYIKNTSCYIDGVTPEQIIKEVERLKQNENRK